MRTATAAAAAALLLLLGMTGALAQLSPEVVSAAIAKRYGVSVLKVTPVKIDGRDAYAVVVMNPGGNDNGAFEVSTLMVDAETGALVPQFTHLPSGYALPQAPDATPPGNDTVPAIRSMTAREYRPR
ncbi:MAG: hypothetical protein ACLQJR_14715 [Stellaceae bacterium]